ALERGCIGVSYGIRYEPGMDMEELLRTAEGCRKSGKMVAAHIRDDAAYVFDAAREFLDAGAELGVALQLSHIGSMAGFGQMRAFLELVDEYRTRGVKVSCDCYPYDAFSTGIGSATYDEGWRERYGCDYDAVELCEGEYKGVRCTEEIFRKVRSEHPRGITVCHVMRQDEVDLAYQHPGVMVASDSTLNCGQGHPRACGCFPRVLSRYVKAGVLSMDEAVARMTAMPAGQLGLKNKGSLQPGMDADIVVFDPETIEDRATFESPLTPPDGIDWVLVGGVPALQDGRILEYKAGSSVRG
ncbi:MAG: amidohydrolase family protein, partial [Oscillospiraceae bacterium]|nr:amidohydrolase family protein [Oscillospiraceae bacterium]